MPADVVDELINTSQSQQQLPHQRLSNREYQIFQLLVAGKPVSDIAASLAISVKTASTHKTNIQEKMGIESIAELIRYALAHDLCSPTDRAPE